ncbi:MAG: hypothetical protein R3C12_03075 [Planctomycetaceae bacterium]
MAGKLVAENAGTEVCSAWAGQLRGDIAAGYHGVAREVAETY